MSRIVLMTLALLEVSGITDAACIPKPPANLIMVAKQPENPIAKQPEDPHCICYLNYNYSTVKVNILQMPTVSNNCVKRYAFHPIDVKRKPYITINGVPQPRHFLPKSSGGYLINLQCQIDLLTPYKIVTTLTKPPLKSEVVNNILVDATI